MKIGISAAFAAAALLGSVLVTAMPAQAATVSPYAAAAATQRGYHGAGYVLDGADAVSMTFVMPNLACTVDNQSLVLGVFGRGFDASVVNFCQDGQLQTGLEIDTEHGGEGGGGTGIAKAGHIIEVTLGGLNTARPTIAIEDTNAPDSALSDHLDGAATVSAVGAYGLQPVLRFPAITVHATVNGGHPFTTVPHRRDNEVRHATTLIKTDPPSSAGTHFQMFFRHH